MKPMLASPAPAKIKFPCYASPKLDGIRCVVKDGKPLSRTLKLIRNTFLQNAIDWRTLNGLDGELIVGAPTANDCMQATTSGVMSVGGEPAFMFYVFDFWNMPDMPYNERYLALKEDAENGLIRQNKYVTVVEHIIVNNEEELLAFETDCLAQGYEGVMLRSLDGGYKYGRSTAREGTLLKVKRFEDGEAQVVGVNPLMHNANEATVDNLGRTERSHSQENLIPMELLGALDVVDCATGVAFSIGTGFDLAQRNQLWDDKESLLGKVVKYKHFANAGVKVAPRFPTFLGFRDPIDME